MANLTFKSTNATTVALNKIGSPDTLSLKYKLNDGQWTDYTEGSSIALSNNDQVQFSGLAKFSKSIQNRYNFATSGEGTLEVSGQLMSLVSSTTIEDKYQFNSLFSGCTNITTITGLEFPYSTKDFCFANMFKDCTGLVDASVHIQDLSDNQTLSRWCYANMFAGCSNLTAIPYLYAENVNSYSLFSMFYGCEKLTSASLHYIRKADKPFALNGIFRNCKSLSSVTVNFNTWTNNANECKNWLKNTKGGVLSCAGTAQPPEGIAPSNWQIAYDETNMPLTFTAIEDDTNILINRYGSPSRNIRYSKNNGEWADWDFNSNSIILSANETIAFSGNNSDFNDGSNYYSMIQGKAVLAKGNVQSLLNFSKNTTPSCFYSLFAGAKIYTPPLLPATGLAKDCYNNMFNNSWLSTTPQLPATDGSSCNRCYQDMFNGCYNIVSARPISTVTWDNCTNGMTRMFQGCGSLHQMPLMNPLSGLGGYSCQNMFSGCTALTGAQRLLFGNEVWQNACDSMFRDCTSLITLPSAIPGSKSSESFKRMFQGCTSLIDASQMSFPLTGVGSYCYYRMFEGCTSLTSTPTLPATEISQVAYCSMFDGCSSLLVASPISARSVPNSGFLTMFRGCSNLSSITIALSSWSSATNATSDWTSGVAAYGNFYCPAALDTSAENNNRRTSRCPVNWTVINI